MEKQPSRQSTGSKRVGGGGMIAKPPRAGSKQGSGQDLRSNSRGSKGAGSQQQLPNLLKNSNQDGRSQQSEMAKGSVRASEDKDAVANTDRI